MLRKDALPKPDAPPGAGRRQLEGFAVAIAMALILKQFTFDTFQVPTESMEPTIIGRGDWGDRLLVDRFAYQFSAPERYDIVVFKYPLSRLVNYVKRAVGLPGERILIFRGQIYAAADGGRDFRVTRKPDAVQEAVFERNPVIPEKETVDLAPATFFRHWESVGPVPAFDGASKGVVLSAPPGAERVVRTKNPITDARRDPMAADAKGQAGGDEHVGDVRLSVDATPSDCEAVVLEIHDPVEPGRPIRLEVAVDGRGTESRLLRGDAPLDAPSLKGVRIPSGRRTRIVLQNADDRVVVLVDGDEAARVEYDVPPVDSPLMERPAEVRVGVRGGSCTFTRLALERDLHYIRYERGLAEFLVPAGSYLMLGDNSPNSLDARGWMRKRIRMRPSQKDPGIVLDGDFEAVSDRIENVRRGRNPYLDDDGRPAFLDVFGNERRLEFGLFDILDAATGETAVREVAAIEPHVDPRTWAAYDHYVPREYVIGRAAIVFFWPPRVLR
jgi:signal peptidase I